MAFWHKMNGHIWTELTSADIAGTLNALRKYDFQIHDLEYIDELSIRFRIKSRDWNKMCKLCEDRGEQLRELSHTGLAWNLVLLKKRPVLVIGIALLLFFSLWISGRVFFVRVEGNSTTTSRQIVETAARCGITFGASRRNVRSEKMKNALLEAMPSLSWAGVNTYGCTAVITVRERSASENPFNTGKVSSIIAIRDGVIKQMTVLRGKGLCTVGEAVKAGQVLISGYTDCGLSIQAQTAQGEIFAETNHILSAIAPAKFEKRGDAIEKRIKISLIIGKKRINFLNSSGISYTGCAKIYEEKYVSLPGGFILPVAIAVETWTFHETNICDLGMAEQCLKDFAFRYLPQQMVGGKILTADQNVISFDDFSVLYGSYYCNEMIGTTRIEENLPDYVKNG